MGSVVGQASFLVLFYIQFPSHFTTICAYYLRGGKQGIKKCWKVILEWSPWGNQALPSHGPVYWGEARVINIYVDHSIFTQSCAGNR